MGSFLWVRILRVKDGLIWDVVVPDNPQTDMFPVMDTSPLGMGLGWLSYRVDFDGVFVADRWCVLRVEAERHLHLFQGAASEGGVAAINEGNGHSRGDSGTVCWSAGVYLLDFGDFACQGEAHCYRSSFPRLG